MEPNLLNTNPNIKKEKMEKAIDIYETSGNEQTATIRGKKHPYVAPSIEITYVKMEENLLTGSGNLRVIAKPEVENWLEEEDSSHEWLGL